MKILGSADRSSGISNFLVNEVAFGSASMF
jgi:hypothetical protein